MTTPQPAALPELPRLPRCDYPNMQYQRRYVGNLYTADQMRAYALAALQAQPADVSDAGAPFGMLRTTCPYCEQGFAFDRPEADASDELVDQHLDAILRAAGSALRHYTMQKSKDDMRSALRRALIALRPQAVPMTDEQFEDWWLTLADYNISGRRMYREQAVKFLKAVEAHHGITAQGAQGEQG